MTTTVIKSVSEIHESQNQVCRLCLSEECLDYILKEKDLQRWISDLLSIVVFSVDRMSQTICAMCRIRIIEFQQFRIRCHEVQGILQSRVQSTDNDAELAVHKSNRESKKIGQSRCQHLEKNVKRHTSEINKTRKTQLVEDLSEGNDDTIKEVDHERVEPTPRNKSKTDKSKDLEMQNIEVKQEPVQGPPLEQEQVENIHMSSHDEEVDCDRAIDIEDMIDLEEVKIETRTDDEDEMLSVGSKSDNSKQIDSESGLTAQGQPTPLTVGDSKDPSFQCKICLTVYQTRQKFKHHFKGVHGPIKYKCHICVINFSTERALKKHLRRKQHLNKLKNTTTGKACNKPEKDDFGTKDKVAKKNMILETPNAMSDDNDSGDNLDEPIVINGHGYTCCKCNRTFKRKGQLKNHMRSHDEKVEDELTVDIETIRLSRVSRQLAISLPKIDLEKPPETPPPTLASGEHFRCDECYKVFTKLVQLSNHKRNHAPRTHACKLCGHAFGRRDNLKKHMKIHKNDIFERHSKTELGQTETNDVQLESDRSSAATEPTAEVKKCIGRLQPFQCNLCYKECQTGPNLRYHKRAVHGPKNHVCLICDVRFTKRFNLRKHLISQAHLHKLGNKLNDKLTGTDGTVEDKSHIGHQKEAIDIVSISNTVPKQHTASDKNPNEYACLDCGQTFKRQAQLKNHVRMHDETVEQYFSSDAEDAKFTK